MKDNSMTSEVETLLADYNSQIDDGGKHTYSETLHHDDGCDCCPCDCLSDLCDCFDIC